MSRWRLTPSWPRAANACRPVSSSLRRVTSADRRGVGATAIGPFCRIPQPCGHRDAPCSCPPERRPGRHPGGVSLAAAGPSYRRIVSSPPTAARRPWPVFGALQGYDRGWLRGDLVAGLTVWAVLVPEALAYATIAGVSPVV